MTRFSTVLRLLIMHLSATEARVFNATADTPGFDIVLVTNKLINTDYNPITAPSAGEVISGGALYTIAWVKSSSSSYVDLSFCQVLNDTHYGCSTYRDLNVRAPNNGTHDWVVGTAIPNGGYYVLLIDDGSPTTGISPYFNISQSAGQGTSSTTSSSVLPQTSNSGSNTASPTPASQSGSPSPSASTGQSPAMIGGAVGGALGGVILALLAALLLILRKRRSKPVATPVHTGTPDTRGTEKAPGNGVLASGDLGHPELDGWQYVPELPLQPMRDDGPHELAGGQDPRYELPAYR